MVSKKLKIISFLSLVFASVAFIGNVKANNETEVVEAADATNADTYYSSLYDSSGNIKYKGSSLKNALNTIISNGHTNKGYGDLAGIYKTSDVDPSSSSKVVLYYTGQKKSWDFSSYSSYDINREHVWCQSLFGNSTNTQSSPYSDAHQVRPCDASLNSSRSNSYYDELTSYTKSDSYGNVWTGDVFYPQADYRGDVARICFYVATRYTNLSLGTTSGSYKMGNINALLKWNLQYGVSSSETKRNNAVAKVQGNRNPFIDHPEYAAYIYGDTNSTTKSIVASYTYDITFNTNGGSSINTQEVIKFAKVVKPSNPTKSGYTFGGWYTNSSLTTAYDFDTKVTGNKTLYAKWTSNSSSGDSSSSGSTGSSTSTPAGVIDFTAQGFSNAEEIAQVIDSSKNVTATLDKGTSSYTPKYYTDGDALRAYAGNTITIKSEKAVKSIEFVFGSSDGTNDITADKGSFASPLWSAASGNTKNITFTIGGTTGNRRIKQMNVTFYDSSSDSGSGGSSSGSDSSESTGSIGSSTSTPAGVIDFTAQGFSNEEEIAQVIDSSKMVTATLEKYVGSYTPKYYTSGNSLRVYAGNRIVIKSEKSVKSIDLVFGDGDSSYVESNPITVDKGEFSSPTWTALSGNTKNITFTIGGTTGQRRIQQMKVNFYSAADGGTDDNIYTESIDFDFTKQGYTNAQKVTEVVDSLNYGSITFGGSGSSTAYYTSGAALRVYANNTITVKCVNYIYSIEFTFGASDGSNTITCDLGTFTSPIWTSTSYTNEVKFTIGGSSGNRRITNIKINYYIDAGGDNGGSEGGDETVTIPEPNPTETSISYLTTNKPTSYSGKLIYIVTGKWTLSTTSTTASTYGNGTLSDDYGNSIVIYGLSSNKVSSVTWSETEGTYAYINQKDFSTLGINDGDTITVGLIYASSYDNYYAYFISKSSSEVVTPTPTPSGDFANQEIETQLGFSFKCEEGGSTSSTSSYNGASAYESGTAMGSTATGGGFKYGSQQITDTTKLNTIKTAFGLKDISGYIRSACSVNDSTNYAVTFNSGSAKTSVVTFDNVNKNATSIKVDLAGWKESSVTISLGNATCNGASSFTIGTATFTTYTLNISDTSKDVTLTASSSEARFALDNVVYTNSSGESWSFNNFYLRFKTIVSKEVFEAQDENATYGVLLNLSSNAPTSFDSVSVSEFNSLYTTANKYLNIEIDSTQIKEENGSYVLTGALTKIPDTQLGTNITAVFYVKNGDTVTFSQTTSKSVGAMVNSYLENTSSLTETQIEALNALKQTYSL